MSADLKSIGGMTVKIELPFYVIKVNADMTIFGIDYGSEQYLYEAYMGRGPGDPCDKKVPVALLSGPLHESILIDALKWWKDAWGASRDVRGWA